MLPVFEAGELADGRLFMAMRLVDGTDLSHLLAKHGRLSVEETFAILSQIAEALDAAHQRGLVHRDVKPANVLLDSTHRGWHAYLTDFGLVRTSLDTSAQTATGELIGTIDYAAPEQINSTNVDHRADVYSFGCMLYRCLTGSPPYRRDTAMATIMAHANAPIPVPSEAVPGLPKALDLVVRRAMEKDPEQRASSAGALMRWARSQLSHEQSPESAPQNPEHSTDGEDDVGASGGGEGRDALTLTYVHATADHPVDASSEEPCSIHPTSPPRQPLRWKSNGRV